MNDGLLTKFDKLVGGTKGMWPDALVGPYARAAGTSIIGALAGRYIAAPLARLLTFGAADKDAVTRNMTLLGAGLGLSGAGVQNTLIGRAERRQKQLEDDFNKAAEWPYDIGAPSIPIGQNVNSIINNPWMAPGDKLQATGALAQAKIRSGGSNVVPPASFIDFTGQTLATAAPYMAAAYGLSKLLGLPNWAQNTTLGAGLLAGAWKTYNDRSV